MPYSDPEQRKAYDRARNKDPRRRAANVAYKRKRYAEDEEYREKVKAASRRTSRAVWRAEKAVHRAIQRGELVRAEFCEECGKGGTIEASHLDYGRPLLIRWLCVSCHRLADRAAPKATCSGR
jgi:ribosomal protein S27AE